MAQEARKPLGLSVVLLKTRHLHRLEKCPQLQGVPTLCVVKESPAAGNPTEPTEEVPMVRLLILLCVVLLAGCGPAPTAPAPEVIAAATTVPMGTSSGLDVPALPSRLRPAGG